MTPKQLNKLVKFDEENHTAQEWISAIGFKEFFDEVDFENIVHVDNDEKGDKLYTRISY